MALLVQSKTFHQGFTVLEILITIAILGSIFLLSTYGLSKLQQSFGAQQVDREILNSISMVTRRARLGVQGGDWGIYIPYDAITRTSQTLTVFHGASYATRIIADDQISSINEATKFISVDFSGAAVNTGNDHEIVFRTLSGSTTQYGSIVMEWYGKQRTIVIDPDGFGIRLPL